MINKELRKYAWMAVFLVTFWNCDTMEKRNTELLEAPVAEKIPHELTRHGETRIDPYYWMRLTDEQKYAEDPDEQTRKVKAYLVAENEYTESMLAHTKELQDKLYQEIVERIKKDDESVPYLKNGYWYYIRYEEGNEYPVYCRKKGNLKAQEEILLNVNELAEGYDYFQVAGLNVSPDNKLLAYGEDTLSRRIYTIRVKNLETGEYLDDQIPNTTGGTAWANDNKTLFYTEKNKVTLLSEKIFRHRVGQSGVKDELVYHEKDPSFYIGVYKSKSGEYIIIGERSTLANDYHILKADDPDGNFKQFTPREDIHEYGIEHYKDRFYIATNWEARNFRLMETPESATTKSNWEEVIPHREGVLLEEIELFDNHLVVSERDKGLTQLRIRNMNSGDEHYLDFGEEAYMAYIGTNAEMDSETLRYVYSSLTTPTTVYDYNMNTREKILKKREEIIGGHDPEEYTTERLYATSGDGKKIPVSVVYRNDFKKNGDGPLLLYGYGSYGATIDPYFSSPRLSLLDRGFAFAIAHIRGSQTLGRAWYEEGKMLNKKNTFNDFIDCAEYLIEKKYTTPGRLFAMGGSAGGLLMGAVVNMAPHLFEGVVAAVPFVDVLTTMSDPTIPLTTNEYDEWGNPSENKTEYEYIKSYSPYDNVSRQEYPNILVTTGFFDSQVQYWEPAKWVAKLREYKTGNNLLLLHTNMDTGHSGSSGRYEKYKETALEYAFMLDLAGIRE